MTNKGDSNWKRFCVLLVSRSVTNLVAAVKNCFSMSSSILPGRFDNGDFECWLREFNACCDANGWKFTAERDDKILKSPAFLRGKTCGKAYQVRRCCRGASKVSLPNCPTRDFLCVV